MFFILFSDKSDIMKFIFFGDLCFYLLIANVSQILFDLDDGMALLYHDILSLNITILKPPFLLNTPNGNMLPINHILPPLIHDTKLLILAKQTPNLITFLMVEVAPTTQ